MRWWVPFFLIAAVVATVGITRGSVGDGSRAASGIDPNEVIRVIPTNAIGSIDDPQFDTVEEATTYMIPTEFVIGVSIDGEHRAYPIAILSVHEIVNDRIGDTPIAVTWCPLCFTAMVYVRAVEGQILELGVSGKLYRNNLVMYDRQTESEWIQATSQAITGPLAGSRLEPIPAIQTTWDQWIGLQPDTLVLSKLRSPYSGLVISDASTAFIEVPFYFSNRYGPYYDAPDAGIRGRAELDDRLEVKGRVLGVLVNGRGKAYAFKDLRGDQVLNDVITGVPVLVFSQDTRFEPLQVRLDSVTSLAYRRTVDGQTLTFELVSQSPGAELCIRDNDTGTTWRALTGEATRGPLAGQQLTQVTASYAFWFAWRDLFPDTELFQPETAVDQPDGNSKAEGALTVFGALTDESAVRAEGGDYAA